MQIEWLEDFIALANLGSFSRAAESRFVTHPAFGRRIRALEDWAGALLVERTQPVRLTDAGTLLLETAMHSVTMLQSARAQICGPKVKSENTLRIVTGRTLATRFFPDWYAALSSRLGPCPMSIMTGGAVQGIARLHAGDADFLLSYSSPLTRMLIDPQHCDSIVIGADELIPVSAPDRNGGARFQIGADSQETVPWLAFSPSLSLRGVLSHHLEGMSRRPRLDMVCEADSYETLLAMTTRGNGLAWLPYMVIKDDLQNGLLRIAGDRSQRVGFDISLHRLKNLSNVHVDAIWNDQARKEPAAT
jgi:DNA-binding transcriptional LysR family regulator